MEYLYVLTCKGMRIAAVQHLKNAGGPAGLRPRVRGRKWCHAVRCCPLLFVWQPHCTEGLHTSWELMGLALHTLFPRPRWSVSLLIRASPGVPSGMKTILCSHLACNMLEEGQDVANLLFVVIHGRLFSSDNETNVRYRGIIWSQFHQVVICSGLVWVRTRPRGHLIKHFCSAKFSLFYRLSSDLCFISYRIILPLFRLLTSNKTILEGVIAPSLNCS